MENLFNGDNKREYFLQYIFDIFFEFPLLVYVAEKYNGLSEKNLFSRWLIYLILARKLGFE
jgi:hypothetical protein